MSTFSQHKVSHSHPTHLNLLTEKSKSGIGNKIVEQYPPTYWKQMSIFHENPRNGIFSLVLV